MIDIDFAAHTEGDLVDLNRRLVAFIRDKRQRDTYRAMAQFAPGDRVWFFDRGGDRIEATVVRVNKKSVSVHADDHHDWSVAPTVLTKISPPASHPLNVFEIHRR